MRGKDYWNIITYNAKRVTSPTGFVATVLVIYLQLIRDSTAHQRSCRSSEILQVIRDLTQEKIRFYN